MAQEAGSLCLFSFPGGKCDPADRDVVHTALRETQEELGLAVPEEQVWGVLRPVHDQVSPSGLQALTPLGPSAHPVCSPWARSRVLRDQDSGRGDCGSHRGRWGPRQPARLSCPSLPHPSGRGQGYLIPLSWGILRLSPGMEVAPLGLVDRGWGGCCRLGRGDVRVLEGRESNGPEARVGLVC